MAPKVILPSKSLTPQPALASEVAHRGWLALAFQTDPSVSLRAGGQHSVTRGLLENALKDSSNNIWSARGPLPLWSIGIFQEFYRAEQKWFVGRDAAKRGEAAQRIPVLDYQNRAPSNE